MNTLEFAVHQCIQLEQCAPDFGLHIGLTGGCLYKQGERKDVDVILYRIRQTVAPDLEDFFSYLVDKGWSNPRFHGWVTKLTSPSGAEFDFFYPEYVDKATFWDRLKAAFSSDNESGSGY